MKIPRFDYGVPDIWDTCTPQVHGSIDYVRNKRFRLTGKCFGNLISPKHVITAALCIIDKYECQRYKVCASKAYIEEMRVAQVLSYNINELKHCTTLFTSVSGLCHL